MRTANLFAILFLFSSSLSADGWGGGGPGISTERVSSDDASLKGCYSECVSSDPSQPFVHEPMTRRSNLCVSEIGEKRFLVEADCQYRGRWPDRQVKWEVVRIVREIGTPGAAVPFGKSKSGTGSSNFSDSTTVRGCHEKFMIRKTDTCRKHPPEIPTGCPCEWIEDALKKTARQLETELKRMKTAFVLCREEEGVRKECEEYPPQTRRCAVRVREFALEYKRYCRSCPQGCSGMGTSFGAPFSYHTPALGAPEIKEWVSYDTKTPVLVNTIQIALLLDLSTSMAPLLKTVKENLKLLVRELEHKHDAKVEIAMYSYGDSKSGMLSLFITKLIDFTRDIGIFEDILDRLVPFGEQENVGAVIEEALYDLNWLPKDQALFQAIIIAGNETIHQGPVSVRKAIKATREADIPVHTIYVGPRKRGTRYGWEGLANSAGGTYNNIAKKGPTVELQADQLSGSFIKALDSIFAFEMERTTRSAK